MSRISQEQILRNAGGTAPGDSVWERTFDAIEDFVTILDAQMRIVRVNAAIAKAFNFEPGEAAGVSCFELFFKAEKPCKACPASLVREDHKTHTSEVLNRRSGKAFMITASPILDDHNRLLGFVHITKDITDRKRTEEALQRAYDEMESRVQERTAKLLQANQKLQTEISERTRTEKALRKRETELDFKSKNLAEVNTALRVLLKTREEDKRDLEERLLSNVKDVVLPYVERLKDSPLNHEQAAALRLLESNLRDIVSPFSKRLSSKLINLTPREIQVADLIKHGKGSKEIAQLLRVSLRTVHFHRESIRRKLALTHKTVHLRSHLLSL